mmetsp:Transcript_85595/g.239008  ORF Transcript_85595/g.239008 Transcript_85595/m.239008 type:complete len:252 (+) Transcript_85595:3033-3788(+)
MTVRELLDEVSEVEKRRVDVAHFPQVRRPAVPAGGLVFSASQINEHRRAAALTVRAEVDSLLQPEGEDRVASRGSRVHRRGGHRAHLVAETQKAKRLLHTCDHRGGEALDENAMLRMHVDLPRSLRGRGLDRREQIPDLLVINLEILTVAGRIHPLNVLFVCVEDLVQESRQQTSAVPPDIWAESRAVAEHGVSLARPSVPIRQDANVVATKRLRHEVAAETFEDNPLRARVGARIEDLVDSELLRCAPIC